MGFNVRRLPVVKRVVASLRRRLRRLVNAEPFGIYRYVSSRSIRICATRATFRLTCC
jgi:hypothetical protein